MAQSDTVAYNASGLNGKNQEFFNIEGFMLSPDKLTGILIKDKKIHFTEYNPTQKGRWKIKDDDMKVPVYKHGFYQDIKEPASLKHRWLADVTDQSLKNKQTPTSWNVGWIVNVVQLPESVKLDVFYPGRSTETNDVRSVHFDNIDNKNITADPTHMRFKGTISRGVKDEKRGTLKPSQIVIFTPEMLHWGNKTPSHASNTTGVNGVANETNPHTPPGQPPAASAQDNSLAKLAGNDLKQREGALSKRESDLLEKETLLTGMQDNLHKNYTELVARRDEFDAHKDREQMDLQKVLDLKIKEHEELQKELSKLTLELEETRRASTENSTVEKAGVQKLLDTENEKTKKLTEEITAALEKNRASEEHNEHTLVKYRNYINQLEIEYTESHDALRQQLADANEMTREYGETSDNLKQQLDEAATRYNGFIEEHKKFAKNADEKSQNLHKVIENYQREMGNRDLPLQSNQLLTSSQLHTSTGSNAPSMRDMIMQSIPSDTNGVSDATRNNIADMVLEKLSGI
jgi:hypothetical protein